MVKEDGSLHGVLNWFAVHTTSMNMTNLLVSSDNLGYAAIKMEAMLNPGSLVGKVRELAVAVIIESENTYLEHRLEKARIRILFLGSASQGKNGTVLGSFCLYARRS